MESRTIFLYFLSFFVVILILTVAYYSQLKKSEIVAQKISISELTTKPTPGEQISIDAKYVPLENKLALRMGYYNNDDWDQENVILSITACKDKEGRQVADLPRLEVIPAFVRTHQIAAYQTILHLPEQSGSMTCEIVACSSKEGEKCESIHYATREILVQ